MKKESKGLKTRGIPEYEKYKMDPTPQWIAIDTGSTGVRSAMLLSVPDLSNLDDATQTKLEDVGVTNILALSSEYVEVPQGMDNIPVKRTDCIEDNLDMTITNQMEKPYIREIRIVKGGLLKHARRAATKVAGSTEKINQKQTYVNAIAMIAISILNKAIETQTKAAYSTTIDLTFALPSEELSNKINRDLIKERLVGKYAVKFNRLGIEIAFLLTEDRIHLISEAQAEANYAVKFENWNLDKKDAVAFMGIGGRNSGNLLMVNGTFLEGLQHTSDFGGRNLIMDIASAISQVAERPITMAQGEEALKTGHITFNGKAEDYLEIVNQQKELFANYAFQEFLSLLDSNGKSLDQISTVVLSGRTLGSAVVDGLEVSPSLFTHFESLIRDISNDLEVKQIKDIYPIPYGALQARINLEFPF